MLIPTRCVEVGDVGDSRLYRQSRTLPLASLGKLSGDGGTRLRMIYTKVLAESGNSPRVQLDHPDNHISNSFRKCKPAKGNL